MMKMLFPRALKAAFAAGALTTLANCAHDANSQLAYETLEASDSKSSIVDLGYAAAARGDHGTAIQYFRSAHAKNLAYAFADSDPLLGLGQSLLAIGQYGDAAKVFVKAAKAGGGSIALRGLAQAQLHMRQPGLAVESARRAVQLDPTDEKSVGILGVALDVLGDHQGAESIYADAMTRFPGSLSLASNHGLSLVMTSDMEAGVRLLEDVVRDPRATARDRQNLALAYALAGDYDRGAALAAIDLDVSGVRANLLYADMLRAMSPNARLAALVMGAHAPKTDKSQNANAVYIKGDNAAWVDASIRRLVPVEGSADLAGVPPLMDPTGWAVQIAAYRKLEHLAPGWAYLSSKYASIIGGLEPRRSEVNHPPAAKGPVGFFYRLNAGPLRSKQEAVDICTRMKARGAECWVRPPTIGEGRLPSDQMASKTNAAESAMVASSDYNAVVNQFARAMVMKSRQDAPASTRDLPPIMMAQKTAAPAQTQGSVTPAAADRVAAETVKPDATALRKAFAEVPYLTPIARPSTVVPRETLLAEMADVPTLTPLARPSTVAPATAVVAVTMPRIAPTPAPRPEKAQSETQTETAPAPRQEAAPARVQNVSAMQPSAATPSVPPTAKKLEALSQVFDAMDDVETQPAPSAPKFAEDPAYDETTSVDAPSPGQIIPAMTPFSPPASKASLISGPAIDGSGKLLPALEKSGLPKESVQNGVY